MTIRRDFKRRVRARQVRTGESYVTARRHLEGETPDAPAPPFPTVELTDLTDAAAALGFRCRVHVFPAVLARTDAAGLLTRLRDALLAGEDSTARFRAVALQGEAPPMPTPTVAGFQEAQRFVERARAGLGGVSRGGSLLAIPAGDALAVCVVWTAPPPWHQLRAPAIVIGVPDSFLMAERFRSAAPGR